MKNVREFASPFTFLYTFLSWMCAREKQIGRLSKYKVFILN